MALTGKEFVKKVADYIEPLFKSSEEQTQAYFRNDPDLDEAIFNFKRRMFNERMNIVEIGKTLVEKPASTDPNHLKLFDVGLLALGGPNVREIGGWGSSSKIYFRVCSSSLPL